MAEVKETILIDVKLDKGNNEREVENLTKKIEQLKKANQDLTKENKELAKAGQENSKQYIENAKQIEINRQKISDNTASRRTLIQAMSAEVDTIRSLQIQNNQLIKQRNSISVATEEGRAKIQEINKQIDDNNEVIRENVSQLEKQKINIGNYASALEGVAPGIAGFIQGTLGMVGAIKQAITATLAFIATPLGATLAALALVLAPVVAFFRQHADGMDAVSDAGARLRGALGVLERDFINLGKSMVEVVKDNAAPLPKFLQKMFELNPIVLAARSNIELLNKVFPQLQQRMKEAADVAERYNSLLRDLEDRTTFLRIEESRLSNEIKSRLIQSRDITKSEQERINLIDQAIALESSLTLKRKGLVEDELSLLVDRSKTVLNINQLEGEAYNDFLKRVEGRTELLQMEGETQAQYAERLILEVKKIDEELSNSLADSIIRLNDAEGQSLVIVEKLLAQKNKLLEAQFEKEKKDREERLGVQAALDEAYYAEILQIGNQASHEFFDLNQLLADDTKRIRDEQEQADKLYFDQLNAELQNSLKEQQAYTKRVQQLKDSEVSAARNLSSTLAVLFQKDAAAARGFTLLSIALNSAQGISAAVKAGAGIPWPGNLAAILSGITAVLGGIAQARSAIQGFASGGIIQSNLGAPINRSNGDNRLITAKVGEAILTPEQQSRVGRDRLAAAGVPGFATGGIVTGEQTRIASNAARESLDVNQLASLVNQTQPVLVWQDFELSRDAIEQPRRTAIVIQ